ncbi:MAG: hypothetical protein EOP84_01725 [Verrucomicrobiaceae bacterium]|nr:MAG: hypothetical protein EOP84_01725 [Verrucomicrobiaceae bacterium]
MRTLTRIPTKLPTMQIAQVVYVLAMVTTVIALIVGSNNLHAQLNETRMEVANQTDELNETRRELREALARLSMNSDQTSRGVDEITKPVDLPGAAKNARP